MKKIIFINSLIFIFLLFLIEIFFGYWFDPNNFGILMKKQRLHKSEYKVKFEGKEYQHFYKRNFYGFRGDDVDPKFKKIIFIGGSTGNQRFTPEEFTIVGQLNTKLRNNDIDQRIFNASMDGKSTFGIINDFKFWFPKLEEFQPKLFIFYIGLNDKFYRGNCKLDDKKKFDSNDCQISFDLKNRVIDYVKNNSITYYLLKKVKYKYFDSEIKLRYDFFGYENSDKLYENFNYIDYKKASKIHNSKLKSEQEIFIEIELKKRLKKISEFVEKYNSEAIYITQVQHDGLSNRPLYFANEAIKEFSRENGYILIPLDEIAKMQKGDFYDPWHTTIAGSSKITSYIGDVIINKILNTSF